MGWPVQGCWPKVLSGKKRDEALAAAAAAGQAGNLAFVAPEPTAVHRSAGQDLLACGFQDGSSKLFRYPCLSKKAGFVGLQGHSADVPSVRFSCDDQYVITVGRTDRTIMVWRVDKK